MWDQSTFRVGVWMEADLVRFSDRCWWVFYSSIRGSKWLGHLLGIWLRKWGREESFVMSWGPVVLDFRPRLLSLVFLANPARAVQRGCVLLTIIAFRVWSFPTAGPRPAIFALLNGKSPLGSVTKTGGHVDVIQQVRRALSKLFLPLFGFRTCRCLGHRGHRSLFNMYGHKEKGISLSRGRDMS